MSDAHGSKSAKPSMLSGHRRFLFSAGLAVVAAVVLVIATSALDLSVGDALVGSLGVYLVAYLAITLVAFSKTEHESVLAWANTTDRGTFWQRYVLGTATGPGASLFIAGGALAVAVVWLPADDGATLPHPARVAIALTLAALAWASVAVSFAVTFHADDLRRDGNALQFPDTKTRLQWSDYVYFAVAVMATFGTTDVNVQGSEMRRTVTVNAIIAFVFNTVIVATLVSALADL